MWKCYSYDYHYNVQIHGVILLYITMFNKITLFNRIERVTQIEQKLYCKYLSENIDIKQDI